MRARTGLAVALAAFAGSAFAQSTVTLYGVLDSGLLYQSTLGPTMVGGKFNHGGVFTVKDGGINSSHWGLTGTEGIGGGYRVNFKLQGSFNSANGGFQTSGTPGVSAAFNQFAMVGVSGPFGRFDAGRQIVPMISAMTATDVRHGTNFGSIKTAWIGMNQAAGWVPSGTNAPIGALYDDNALVYRSPSFYGATLALEYAPGGVAGQFQGGTRESAVLLYVNGGLNVGAAYYNGHDTNPFPTNYPTSPAIPATGRNNNRFYYLGARYTLQGFSVSASYSAGKNPSNPSRADLDLVTGGLGYWFSPQLEVTSGLYYLRSKSDAFPGHSTVVALGANYSLSKQTTLYADVGHVNNTGIMNQTIVYGSFVAPNANTTAVMLGLRHTF